MLALGSQICSSGRESAVILTWPSRAQCAAEMKSSSAVPCVVRNLRVCQHGHCSDLRLCAPRVADRLDDTVVHILGVAAHAGTGSVSLEHGRDRAKRTLTECRP
jgi:hypothetical protein